MITICHAGILSAYDGPCTFGVLTLSVLRRVFRSLVVIRRDQLHREIYIHLVWMYRLLLTATGKPRLSNTKYDGHFSVQLPAHFAIPVHQQKLQPNKCGLLHTSLEIPRGRI
jgi:hypothetical protein